MDVYKICLHLKFLKVYSGVPEFHLQVHAAICESYELMLVGVISSPSGELFFPHFTRLLYILVKHSGLELLSTFNIWYKEFTFMATTSFPSVHSIYLKF